VTDVVFGIYVFVKNQRFDFFDRVRRPVLSRFSIHLLADDDFWSLFTSFPLSGGNDEGLEVVKRAKNPGVSTGAPTLFDECASCIMRLMFKRTGHPIHFASRNSNFGGIGAPAGNRCNGFLDNLLYVRASQAVIFSSTQNLISTHPHV
jgi:hypothetical protein